MSGIPNIAQQFELQGRTVVVVGAGSGLGQASAVGLADCGAHVIVADLNAEAAAQTVDLITSRGGSGQARTIDITNTAAVTELAAEFPQTAGLVVTPGRNIRKRLLDTSDEEFDQVIDVNLKGTYRLIRAFGAQMANRGQGSIVTFSSFRAEVVEPGQGLYAAAKAGVVQLTKTLASELGPAGVRVNTILPGPFETPLTEQIKADAEWWDAYAQKTAFGRWGYLHEIAGAVVFLISDAASFITGHSQLVDGGWMAQDGRFTPRV